MGCIRLVTWPETKNPFPSIFIRSLTPPPGNCHLRTEVGDSSLWWQVSGTGPRWQFPRGSGSEGKRWNFRSPLTQKSKKKSIFFILPSRSKNKVHSILILKENYFPCEKAQNFWKICQVTGEQVRRKVTGQRLQSSGDSLPGDNLPWGATPNGWMTGGSFTPLTCNDTGLVGEQGGK